MIYFLTRCLGDTHPRERQTPIQHTESYLRGRHRRALKGSHSIWEDVVVQSLSNIFSRSFTFHLKEALNFFFFFNLCYLCSSSCALFISLPLHFFWSRARIFQIFECEKDSIYIFFKLKVL